MTSPTSTRRFKLPLLLAAALLASACGGGNATSSTEDYNSELVEPGVLTVAMNGSAPPYGYIGSDGNVKGFGVTVCTDIAKELGLTPKFVAMDWQGILPGLKANRFDMSCAGISRTEERLGSNAFHMTDATVEEHRALIVQNDSPISGLDSIKNGMVMAGVSGAVQHREVQAVLQDTGIDVTSKTYPTYPQALLDVENNRADFVVGSFVQGTFSTKSKPNMKVIKLAGDNFPPATSGFAVRQQAPELLEVVNDLISKYLSNGKMAEWQEQEIGAASLPSQ